MTATTACPACGSEQPPESRYCGACGSSLLRACAACGSEAPADAAFCSACGAALGEGQGRRTAVSGHEERRVVTVLFADLAGSTALGSRIDPEELRILQGELFELVDAEVERFGGLSEKFVGDAVLAVFGVPLAHDDDAERAVRAGIAVRDRFGEFAQRVRARHGVDVGLRVGINTGEVVAGREAAARGELMVTGDAVNVAARLQQRAEPGQVLVGERTRAATRRAIRFSSVGAAPAKGKDSPVPAWDARAVIASPGQRGVEGLSTEMIGREEELAVLRALTARVGRDRVPQLVTIYGQAGVGKTRLVSEFLGRLPGAHVLQARCLAYGHGITYWPLGEAAKGQAGILDTDPADTALEKLESAVREHVRSEHVVEIVEALGWTIGLALPADDGRDIGVLLRDSWRRYLCGLGDEQLTVLVVEDVHWASEPLLELLESLTESLSDAAVLTICTARPEFFDNREAWGGGARDAASIRLSPLPEATSRQLVEALVGAGGISAELSARIVARAEGNPFHVEEILQMLIDRDAIVQHDGGWKVRGHVDEIELPDTIHGVIAARIDLLDAASREALRRCSVMGRVFWPRAVGVDETLIAALGRRALVTEHSDSAVAGMREFAFKHALTQDVAYSTLPRTERRELHRQVGTWVGDVAPGREAEMAEIAAYHLDRALEYGESTPEVRARACELFRIAGEAALARAAGEPATSLLRRAVELAGEPRERALCLIGLGRAEQMVDPSDRDVEAFAAARDAASASGDPRVLADALTWLSRAIWLSGRFGEALPAARAALDALAGLGETPQLARATARLSQLEMLGGLPQAEQRARAAIALARRVGDPRAEVNARINLANALANRGLPPSIDEAHDIVRRALEVGDAPEAFRCLVNTLWACEAFLGRDEIDAAMSVLQRALAGVPAVESLDAYYDVSYALLVDLPAGDWDALDQPRHPVVRPSGLAMIRSELEGGMALRRGDLDAARSPLAELRAIAERSGEPQRIVPMAGVVAPYAALTGDRDMLRAVSESVLAVIDRDWSSLPASVPRALAAAGETTLLVRVADAYRLKAERAVVPRSTISATVARGLVSMAAGSPQDAADALDDAAQRERALGWVYRAACIDVDLAAALAAAGRDAEAEEARRRARGVLEPLGCVHPF